MFDDLQKRPEILDEYPEYPEVVRAYEPSNRIGPLALPLMLIAGSAAAWLGGSLSSLVLPVVAGWLRSDVGLFKWVF